MHDSSVPLNSMIPSPGLLPSYLAAAFGELYEEDGLMVMAKGLGWMSLLASFVRFYADVEEGHVALMADEPTKHSSSSSSRKPPLVLVLGLRHVEHEALLSILDSWGTPHHMMPKSITNESGQGKDRLVEYEKGGVFCVTSRILIVDLLTNILPSNKIDGFLIAHGHQVTHESTEAFILRIYTSQKQERDQSFIKAFSDAPEALLQGFSKIDKTLKALQVRNLYLYPRFHEAVQEELDEYAPNVEELQQTLSPSMKEIQSAIVAALQTCLKELKGATAALMEWTGEELKIENCAMPNFHQSVKRQLEKDWHRIKPQTRQLVEDLRTLGTLFHILIQSDCVRFWSVLNLIKTNSAGSRYPSLWLLTPVADILFRKAKDRIYKIEPGIPTHQVPNPISKLIPVLEENPKWRLLKTVLTEIQQLEQQQKQIQEEQANETSTSVPPQQTHRQTSIPSRTILVLVKDVASVKNLRSYLIEGRDRALASRFLDYLVRYNDRSRSVAHGKIMSEESRLLHEEESRVRRVLQVNRRVVAQKQEQQRVDAENANQSQHRRRGRPKGGMINAVPDYMRKRRRIALERGRGEIMGSSEDRERSAVLDEAMVQADHEDEDDNEHGENRTGRRDLDEDPMVATDSTTTQDDEDVLFNTMFQPSFIDESRIMIRSFDAFDGDPALLLADMDPDYVIMYDMDVTLVRSLEVYSAMMGRKDKDENDEDKSRRRLKLYLLSFEASAEQKVFQKSLEREKSAFIRLIHHKKTMPPPILQVEGTQEMQQARMSGGVVRVYAGGALPLSMDTRRAGRSGQEKRDIAVDVREFRSALPSILHQGGMRLAPVTLTVGDFVLSNVHCVERKSISDLYGSFASGRLYTQAEAMSKYYKVPSLLIEFDPNKTFSLQSEGSMGVDIRNDSICSKMVLLTSHFPKLRILWSKSPHETLRIFKDLKANHDEVDVEKAVEIGRNDSVEALLVPSVSQKANGVDDDEDDEDEVDEVNEAARDMILRLPGITVHNARRIMNECDSLADLIRMTRMELRQLVGNVAGQKLFTFFHQPYAAAAI